MMQGYRDLIVYKKAFALAMDIFQESKKFPKEEQFGLTSQIRRSSRSVCANIGEGYRKRLYKNHFIAKCSDADMENTETQVWLDFALASGYIDETIYNAWNVQSEEVGKMLGAMIENPDKFLPLKKK